MRCKAPGCRNPAAYSRGLLSWCSVECGAVLAERALSKVKRRDATATKRAQVAERKADRARLRAMEPLGKLKSRAQLAVNRYVKLRDYGLPCFDCGKQMTPNKLGGSVDAGHVRGIGQCPSLRYDLRNIMAERKECNAAGGATDDAKRAGALARLGPGRYAAIDGPQPARKWTREWLLRYARIMNRKARRQAARLVG